MRVCMRGAWVCGYFWTVVRLSERECARVCVHAHTRECTHVYVHTHTHNMRSIEYRMSRVERRGRGLDLQERRPDNHEQEESQNNLGKHAGSAGT